MSSTSSEPERLLLGRISGPHGVRGWVRIHSETEPRANIVAYGRWWLEQRGQWSVVDVLEGHEHGKTVIARLDGVNDRDAAEALRGATVAIPRESLPAAEDGEFYWADLIGLDVVGHDGQRIGTVLRLFETGANDVLVVADEREDVESRQEVLVPWAQPEIVKSVDLAARRIEVDWDPDW